MPDCGTLGGADASLAPPMTEPTTALKKPVDERDENASYAPYGQLVKMLIPSSGCVALYDASGDLIWCSDSSPEL